MQKRNDEPERRGNDGLRRRRAAVVIATPATTAAGFATTAFRHLYLSLAGQNPIHYQPVPAGAGYPPGLQSFAMN